MIPCFKMSWYQYLNLKMPDECSALVGRPESGTEASNLHGLSDGLLELFHYSHRGIQNYWVQNLEFISYTMRLIVSQKTQYVPSSPFLKNDL